MVDRERTDLVWTSGETPASARMVATRTHNKTIFSKETPPQRALVPALPEVVTEGNTEPEALAHAEEAIRAVLAYRRDHGLTIPPDAAPEIRRVTVAA